MDFVHTSQDSSPFSEKTGVTIILGPPHMDPPSGPSYGPLYGPPIFSPIFAEN